MDNSEKVNNYAVECRINSALLESIELIQEHAENILDEVAELKAFIYQEQRKEAHKQNICSMISFYERVDKLKKRRKKQGKRPLYPLIVD